MIEDNKLKIVLATGIYPPDIGGPATYVAKLAEELPKRGCEVKVVTYGEMRNAECGMRNDGNVSCITRGQNIVFRYLKYFLAVYRLAKSKREYAGMGTTMTLLVIVEDNSDVQCRGDTSIMTCPTITTVTATTSSRRVRPGC